MATKDTIVAQQAKLIADLLVRVSELEMQLHDDRNMDGRRVVGSGVPSLTGWKPIPRHKLDTYFPFDANVPQWAQRVPHLIDD